MVGAALIPTSARSAIAGMAVAVTLLACGPTDRAPPVEGPPAACVPSTCAQAGAECGSIADGCGGTLECGGCSDGGNCGGGNTSNVCEPRCAPITCESAGKDCGALPDGCGGTLGCGTCASGETCGGGGESNVCGKAACAPTTCDAEQKNCGVIDDGCGNSLQCGSCSDGEICGGGGEDNVCGSEVPEAVEWSREWDIPLWNISARENDVVALMSTSEYQPRLLQVLGDGTVGWTRPFLDEGKDTTARSLVAGRDNHLFISGTTPSPDRMSGTDFVLELSANGSEASTVARREAGSSMRVEAAGGDGSVAWREVDGSQGEGARMQVRRSDGSLWRSPNQGEWIIGVASLMANGGLAMTGRLWGAGTLDHRVLGAEGEGTVVLAVLEDGGALKWLHLFPDSVEVHGLGTTAEGAVIAAVSFSGTLSWGDSQHSGERGRVLLIADADGSPTGMVRFPDQPRDDSSRQLFPFSLAVAADGSLAVAVGETCSVGIWRWDPTLQLRWKRDLQVRDCAGEIDAEVQLLPNEEVIVGGRYYGALEITGTAVLSKRTNFGGFLMNFGR